MLKSESQPCVAVHLCVGFHRDLYGDGAGVGLLLRRGLACALHCHYDAQCVAAAAHCPRRVGGLHRKRCAVRCHYSRHAVFVVRGVLVRRQMDHAAAARGGPAQPCGSHPVRRGTGSAAYLAQPSPQRACRKAALAGCDGEIKVSPDGAEPSGDALPSPAGEGGRTQ